jgi:hypothetical protein
MSFSPLPHTLIRFGERGKGKGEREKEKEKGKGFKYVLYPLPLNLFPDHKVSSYCLSEPYCPIPFYQRVRLPKVGSILLTLVWSR